MSRSVEISTPRGLLHRLCFGDEPLGLKLLFVVAHPDDEVIGAGAQLPRWANARFIHTTDGAPRDMKDATASGFRRREDYVAARRNELASGLRLAGINSEQTRSLGFVDQEASSNLVALVCLLEASFQALHTDAIMTHPYEGGHPDHDATAFAVHVARQRLQNLSGNAPAILELTSYHNRSGMMEAGEFLPCGLSKPITFPLTREQREFKQGLFDCFVTQQAVLKAFPLECERFRPAPAYDFTLPPHEGRLYYEMFDWGMTGSRWRTLASAALEELGLLPPIWH